MWTITELKQRGRNAFTRNYMKCVIAAFILVLLASGSGNGGGNNPQNQNSSSYEQDMQEFEQDMQQFENDMNEFASSALGTGVNLHNGITQFFTNFLPASISTVVSGLLVGVAGLMVLVIGILVLIFNIVVTNVIEVGGCRFFLKNSYEKERVGEILWGFREGRYVNLVLTQFLRTLFTGLWTMLFIIPGIIKSYEYRMIPYILAENPDMSWRDAFAKSKQMMYGQKMNAFILDLSFFGWNILSGLTGGLSGIFYSNPYQYATNAELFLTLNGGFEGTGYSYQQRWQDAYENGTVWEDGYDYQKDQMRPEYTERPAEDGWNQYTHHSPDEYEPQNNFEDDDRTYR